MVTFIMIISIFFILPFTILTKNLSMLLGNTEEGIIKYINSYHRYMNKKKKKRF